MHVLVLDVVVSGISYLTFAAGVQSIDEHEAGLLLNGHFAHQVRYTFFDR